MRNWFSNFKPFEVPYKYQGITYIYPENFYQAMKCWGLGLREHIASLSPRDAKGFWKINKDQMRPDWFDINLEVMEYAVRVKFQPGTKWYYLLLKETGDIVEWNYWHDNFFGICTCETCKRTKTGFNHLGKILMRVRDENPPQDLWKINF